MSSFDEILIEFLRSEGHQLEVHVKQGFKFICSKVYFNRDPSGVLRGSALTAIQADQRLVNDAWNVVGSPVLLMEKRRIFVVEAAVIGTTSQGASLVRLSAIRSLMYSVVTVETYCIIDGGLGAVIASSGTEMLRKIDRSSIVLSPTDRDMLVDLMPVSARAASRKPVARYVPSYYFETDRFFASLAEANSQPA